MTAYHSSGSAITTEIFTLYSLVSCVNDKLSHSIILNTFVTPLRCYKTSLTSQTKVTGAKVSLPHAVVIKLETGYPHLVFVNPWFVVNPIFTGNILCIGVTTLIITRQKHNYHDRTTNTTRTTCLLHTRDAASTFCLASNLTELLSMEGRRQMARQSNGLQSVHYVDYYRH